MEKIIIKGGNTLRGTIEIDGAKNSALPILAASILSDEEIILKNVPNLTDIHNMLTIISDLGAKTEFDVTKKVVKINPKTITTTKTNKETVIKLRASFLLAGSLLGKYKKAEIYYPGGCSIGTRPIDLHLNGFKKMGIKIENTHGYIKMNWENSKDVEIFLDFPSVGATENLILSSVKSRRKTTLYNIAEEPEIFDLINFLNMMGAKIVYLPPRQLVIEGVEKLKGVTYEIMPDRIEAGTYMIATALTKGSVFLKNISEKNIKPLVIKLRELNIEIKEKNNGIYISAEKINNKPFEIKTMPHPGFPTDLQPQTIVLMTQCKGTSICIETIFDNRFKHINELKKMGAEIKLEGNRTCIVEGGKKLTGATVEATDLRAGISLVLAGLITEDETIIEEAQHIFRGYANLEKKFKTLGANIKIIV